MQIGGEMRFGILGPLCIESVEDQIFGHRSREALILGALLLNAGRRVSATDLADMIWGNSPPPTFRQQVQNCASPVDRRLREVGLPTLRRLPNGYRLDVRSDELDALAFEAGAAAGRRALKAG